MKEDKQGVAEQHDGDPDSPWSNGYAAGYLAGIKDSKANVRYIQILEEMCSSEVLKEAQERLRKAL